MLEIAIATVAVSIPMFCLVFMIALGLTKLLNPTASVEEIFNHWRKVWRGETEC